MYKTIRVNFEVHPLWYLGLLSIKILIYLPQVKYKGEIKQATTISDLPELKRVKENQRNISNV